MCAAWKKTRLHPGGLAERFRVEAEAVATDTFRLPDSVSFEDGALVEPVACAVKAVRKARVAAGDSVAVIGLGANGILLGLVAKSAGAATGPSARVVFYSPIQPGRTWTIEPHLPYLRDLSLLFSYSCGAADMRAAITLLERGVVRAASIVTHRRTLARAAEAFALARRGGDVLKVVVTV